MDYRERIGDDEESLRMAFDSIQAQIWTALPAIVASVDFAKMTLSAQPTITGSILQKDGSKKVVNMPLLLDCPFTFPTAGGYSLTLPLKVGDEVLVVFASRCIDAWWQNGGIQNPIEHRMHDLSDGFAIIGTRSQVKLFANYNPDTAQLRNDNGDVYVEIDTSGTITLKAPTSITLDTPNVYATGTITATGNVIGSGKSLATHTHSGVTSGTSNTGVPN